MNIIVLTDWELIAVYAVVILASFVPAWKMSSWFVDRFFPVRVKNEMPALPQKSSV